MKNKHYEGCFDKWDEVVSNFGGNCPAKEPRYVFAAYEQPSYEGYATVITSSNGKSFEVTEGSHCSCCCALSIQQGSGDKIETKNKT